MTVFARSAGPVDGNLTRHTRVDSVSGYGFRIDDNWTHTDPAGHTHTKASLYSTTYQPSEEIYCVDCEGVEERPVGERRCRECEAEITPKILHGHWRSDIPAPAVWTVEYIGPNSSRVWREVPDELGFEIAASDTIEPFLERLGEPWQMEWSG